jgi:hypothetical protein
MPNIELASDNDRCDKKALPLLLSAMPSIRHKRTAITANNAVGDWQNIHPLIY